MNLLQFFIFRFCMTYCLFTQRRWLDANEWIVRNWKRSWPNLRNYTGVFLDDCKNTKPSCQTVSHRVRTKGLEYTRHIVTNYTLQSGRSNMPCTSSTLKKEAANSPDTRKTLYQIPFPILDDHKPYKKTWRGRPWYESNLTFKLWLVIPDSRPVLCQPTNNKPKASTKAHGLDITFTVCLAPSF